MTVGGVLFIVVSLVVLPMNITVVDDANKFARVLFALSGERTVTVL